jgi:hypothetical protein
VVHSAEWQGLPFGARVLAVDLMGQYTGKNNGRLCPAWEAMQRCGWKSETTLLRAKRALIECSVVIHTRKGHRPRTSDWIGFTWWNLDWDKSMDIGPRDFPYLNFMKTAPIDPNVGRQQAKVKTLFDLSKRQDKASKQAPGPIEMMGRGTLQ